MSRRLSLIVCLSISVVWFAFNHAGVISGWLDPPVGYVPLFHNKGLDTAQYLTWAKAFETESVLPNYHAPWITEPALFNPVIFLLARTSVVLGASFVEVYNVAHFLVYLLAGYGWSLCITTFTRTRKEAVAAIVVTLCSVPVSSLLALPLELSGSYRVPGMGAFLSVTFDSFLHGLPGGLLATLGTALTLVAFSRLGAYVHRPRSGPLAAAIVATLVSAIAHPFEVVVIVAAGAGGLLLLPSRRAAVALALAGAAGLSLYAYSALQADWIRAAASQNIFHPGNPIKLLAALGMPSIVGLCLLAARPTPANSRDGFLSLWVVATLVLMYIPVLPWSQHLIDGYHIAIGLLVVRKAADAGVVLVLRRHVHRGLTHVVAAGLVILSVGAYPVYWSRAFQSGRLAAPVLHFSTVTASTDLEVTTWFQHNARPDELVLGPIEIAPWLATVPMHSFGSHWVFSLDFGNQAKFSEDLFAGRVDPDRATAILDGFGVRYVVARTSDHLRLDGYTRRTIIGPWEIFDKPGNEMKAWTDPNRFQFTR